MPQSGPEHESMIQRLKKRGIIDEALKISANKTADAIWEHLQRLLCKWVEFQPDISATLDCLSQFPLTRHRLNNEVAIRSQSTVNLFTRAVDFVSLGTCYPFSYEIWCADILGGDSRRIFENQTNSQNLRTSISGGLRKYNS